MQGDFLVKMRTAYNQFTRAEKKVADYILQNPKEVLFMSITDLAEACHVGDTSVFRFCKSMELKGYQEFKMVLSLSLNKDEKESSRFSGDISLSDTFQELARKVLNININALTETYALLNETAFNQAVDWLHEAERIVFFGVGASILTALKATNKFLRIEPKVYCIQDSHMQAMTASMMKPGEVAVLFSYSGATKDTIHVARMARGAGSRVICVTRFSKSPLTSYADLILLSGANESPLQGGSTSGEISQLFLVDLLYTEYYRRYFDVCSKNNEKTSGSVLERLY